MTHSQSCSVLVFWYYKKVPVGITNRNAWPKILKHWLPRDEKYLLKEALLGESPTLTSLSEIKVLQNCPRPRSLITKLYDSAAK